MSRVVSILKDYFGRHWMRYVVGVLLVFLSAYLTALIPRLLGSAVDLLNSIPVDTGLVEQTALLMALTAVSAFVSRFVWRYLILGFCRQIEFHLRESVFAHLQHLDMDYYIKNNTGDLITRSIVDVQAVRMMMGFVVVAMIEIGRASWRERV